MDALARRPALTLDRLRRAGRRGRPRPSKPLQADSSYAVNTDLRRWPTGSQRSRELARQLVPVAFVPLAAIAFFVIYLAVGYGVFGRRHELGLVALRGVTPARRWWLATGETALVILAGAPVGYLLGYLGVAAVARSRLGCGRRRRSAWTACPTRRSRWPGRWWSRSSGQRRALREPVVDLLRGVPRGRSAWRSAVGRGAGRGRWPWSRRSSYARPAAG